MALKLQKPCFRTKLPKETRPELYLFGLSLGSLNSDLSSDLFGVIADPFQGAFWVGPPFASRTWNNVTAARTEDSPAWLPKFRDGSMVRFTSQTNTLESGDPWGIMRIVYLQYASDAIVFFETDMMFHKPDWLKTPRGPDVSEKFVWYPIVSFGQMLFDMMTATTTPIGHGHVYAAANYLDGWIAVTQPKGWSDAAIADLKAVLTARGI
jgi:uncharacterized membrane protein